MSNYKRNVHNQYIGLLDLFMQLSVESKYRQLIPLKKVLVEMEENFSSPKNAIEVNFTFRNRRCMFI